MFWAITVTKKKLVLDLNDPVCVKSGGKYVSAYNEFKYFR